MITEFIGEINGRSLKIGIIISRFNEIITKRLLEGAKEGLISKGVNESDINVAWVPGSLELGLIAKVMAESRRYDTLICLGAVIRGETSHYDIVSWEGAYNITRVSYETGVPTIFGVLTTENSQQALDRSGGKVGNKGYDAAITAIQMANLLKIIKKDG